jgi:hypothetical protein
MSKFDRGLKDERFLLEEQLRDLEEGIAAAASERERAALERDAEGLFAEMAFRCRAAVITVSLAGAFGCLVWLDLVRAALAHIDKADRDNDFLPYEDDWRRQRHPLGRSKSDVWDVIRWVGEHEECWREAALACAGRPSGGAGGVRHIVAHVRRLAERARPRLGRVARPRHHFARRSV